MPKSLFYEYYGGHLGFLQNTTCYTCKKKMEPYFFSSRSYSEPESVAKSILTNQKSEITNGPALFLTRRNVETIANVVYPRLSFLPVALHCEIYCEYGTLHFDKETNKQTNK